MRSIYRSPIFAAVLVLSACASDEAAFIRQNGAVPEPKRLEADAKDCGRVGTPTSGYLGGGLLGAARGAYYGAGQGAADGAAQGDGSALDALGGMTLGFLAGMVTGAFGSASGDNYDLCMARKGYQRVDAQQVQAVTETETAPVIVRRTQP